jgi:hypothetical protein
MRFIGLNDDILDILQPHSDWFFNQDLSELFVDQKGDKDAEYSRSWEYLQEMLEKPMGKGDNEHHGPPEIIRNVHFGVGAKSPKKFRDAAEKLNDDLVKFLGARQSAVHVYYPEDGYMGWHNNWDVPGYNILFNYNKGNGYFEHYDGTAITRLPDPGGWSAKVGYYGDQSDPYWHCAGGGPRITLGFVIPDKNMWEMMIEDIST